MSTTHVDVRRGAYHDSVTLLQISRTVAQAGCPDVEEQAVLTARAFAAALRPNTRLVMLETPSNPLLQLTDLRAVAGLARERGIRTLADNTVATPVNQRPLECGVDLVVHSVTKSLSGHSDVLAGVIAGSGELIDRI